MNAVWKSVGGNLQWRHPTSMTSHDHLTSMTKNQTRLSDWIGLISVHVHSGFSSIPSPSFQPGLSFVCPQSLKSCLTFWDPMDSIPPGSSVHKIFQARIMNWVAISFPRESSQPRDWTWVSWVSCIDRWILYHYTTWKALGVTEHASNLALYVKH